MSSSSTSQARRRYRARSSSVSAAQNGCTSATSSTTPCTFAGVSVSTLPISSPVTGLNESSPALDLEPFADLALLRGLAGALPFPLWPLALELLVVLLELASIDVTPSRGLRSVEGDSTRAQRPPAEAAAPSSLLSPTKESGGREQSPSSRPPCPLPGFLRAGSGEPHDCQSVRQRSEHRGQAKVAPRTEWGSAALNVALTLVGRPAEPLAQPVEPLAQLRLESAVRRLVEALAAKGLGGERLIADGIRLVVRVAVSL